jgi:hypothetical protein
VGTYRARANQRQICARPFARRVTPVQQGLDALRLRGKGSSLAARPLEALPMSWVTPTFVEIDMSAEIGSYQDDFDGI